MFSLKCKFNKHKSIVKMYDNVAHPKVHGT